MVCWDGLIAIGLWDACIMNNMREPVSRHPQILGGLRIAFVAQRPAEARATNLRTAPPEVWDIDWKATPTFEKKGDEGFKFGLM